MGVIKQFGINPQVISEKIKYQIGDGGQVEVVKSITEEVTAMPSNLLGVVDEKFTDAKETFDDATGVLSDFASDPSALLDSFAGSLTDQITDKISDISAMLGGFADSVTINQVELANKMGLADAVDTVANPSVLQTAAVNPNTAPPLPPTTNALHEYSSFTYNLTLSAMTMEAYNTLALAPGSSKEGTMLASRAIISSGGKDAMPVMRDPIFKDDFYIEDLVIGTVIGQADYTQSSNAIKISFTVFEPYGATLIDRISALANTLGFKTITEIPYVMKIEFKGYIDDGGDPVSIPNTTKYIPLTIANITLKTGTKGTAYAINAIPVNHNAYNQVRVSLHTVASVAASSVDQFFNGKQTGSTDGMHKGLAEIVNDYHKSLTKSDGSKPPSRLIADEVAFEFDPFIGQNKIVINNNKDRPEKVSGDKAVKQQGEAVNNTAKAIVATGETAFRFNPGTSIVSIINTVVTGSEYILQQLTDDTTKECNSEKPLNWFRITPKVEYLGYDTLARRHAYRTTYIVTTYDIYGQKLPIAPQAKPREITKAYDYMFTGNNQDIIDLDLEFNMAYFTAISKSTATASAGTNDTMSSFAKAFADSAGIAPDDAGVNPMSQSPIEAIGPNLQVGGHGYGGKNTKRYLASDLENSLLSSSRGDMIVVDINILGDPALIKQDDLLYLAHEHRNEKITPTGSVLQDAIEVYIRLSFRIPDDIDHETGLMKFGMSIGGENKLNVFSGLYRVMVLDNTFSNGTFTQQVVLMRVYNQDPCQNVFDEPPCDALCMLEKEGHIPGDQSDFDINQGLISTQAGVILEQEGFSVRDFDAEEAAIIAEDRATAAAEFVGPPNPITNSALETSRGAGTTGNTTSSALTTGERESLEIIASGEGTTDAQAIAANKDYIKSGYDVPFSYGEYLAPPKPLSTMTVSEVKAFQAAQIPATRGTFNKPGYGTSAVGKYQVMGSTLLEHQQKLGFSDDDIFSPELQDRIGMSLLKEDGYNEMLRGTITPVQFQDNVSGTWASIPKASTGLGSHDQPIKDVTAAFQTTALAAKVQYVNTPPPTPVLPPTKVAAIEVINGIVRPKPIEILEVDEIDPALYAELGIDPRLMN